MADYPNSIPSFAVLVDNVDDVLASHQNTPNGEIVAIATELGTLPKGSAADVKTRLARSLSGIGNLDFATSTELTIATGAIVPTQNWHTVDTEADAASDDLDTITATNATDGFILFVRANNDARTTVVKHNTGNILCATATDITLDDQRDLCVFIYDATLTKWLAGTFSIPNDSAYTVKGLTGTNNSGTPNTQYDFAADVVSLRNPSTGNVMVRTNTGTITNNVSTAGSTANGRDQAGAFSASSWIHFYFIWNGTTLATLSSATAPPTGPTLPSGYTYWAYIGAVRFNGSSQLVATKIRGNSVFYTVEQLLVSGGSATTETTVDTSAFVPPNAGTLFGKVTALHTNSSANVEAVIDIRAVSGADFFDARITSQVANIQMRTDSSFMAPNVSQTLYYIWSNPAGATKALYLICAGYTIPN